jgi:hypothetical protein
MHGQQSWGINPEVESGIQTNRQKNVAHLRNLFFFWLGRFWLNACGNFFTLSDPLMNKVCQQMYTATVRHKSLLENTGDFCGMRFYTSNLVTVRSTCSTCSTRSLTECCQWTIPVFQLVHISAKQQNKEYPHLCRRNLTKHNSSTRMCWVGTQDPPANWPFLVGWKPSIYDDVWKKVVYDWVEWW